MNLVQQKLCEWCYKNTDVKQKHLESAKPPPEALIEGPTRRVHPVVFDNNDVYLILKTAMLTKAGSRPSGLNQF